MKTKMVLCVVLIILIALGSLNNLIARKAPSTVRQAHTWAGEAAVKNLKSPSGKNVYLFFSFSRIPFGIYVNILSAPNIGCQDPKEIPIKKGNKDGANKEFNRY
jgi:hypothetical protein